MASVLHGRRKGSSKEGGKKGALGCNTHGDEGGTILPDGTDLRQVTVLTKQDWERIQNEMNCRQIRSEMARQVNEEREEQKRRSKEIIKNWSNTIAGQRQRKLEARKVREGKEEEERKQVDLEEAKYQAQQRKEALDKAKTQQYYQTDRVKNFHSALTLTEVLKEREAQVELKRLKDFSKGDLDKEYAKLDKELCEKSIQAEYEKTRANIEAAHKAAEFQLAQIQENMANAEKEKLDDRKEGEELTKLAAKFNIEREKLENLRKEERKMVMKDNLLQIDDVKKIKLLKEKQEEEEDEECRVFAVAKRKMMKLRAQKEFDIHNEKQMQLDRIKEKLTSQMKQKFDDEEDRLFNAVGEIEKKRLEEERAKEEKLLKEIREQAEHRNKQLKEKEEKLKHERAEDYELFKMRNAADELFRQNEIEKSVRRRQEAEQTKNFVIDQYNDRVNKEEERKKVQLALDKASVQLFEKEEAQFQEYARTVINHCRERGRNVYPLEKAAMMGQGGGQGPTFPGRTGIRPSYLVSDESGGQLPHYQRDSTNETKVQINGKSTSKNRLGFVW